MMQERDDGCGNVEASMRIWRVLKHRKEELGVVCAYLEGLGPCIKMAVGRNQ
jgi:hypothetical protein